MVLGPKVVVWKCFFEKFIKKFCGTNLCVNCTCGYRFRTAFSAATKYIQTTSNMVLGPKVVVWKCFFEKFIKNFCGTNLCVNCTCGYRFRTAFGAATKYIQTTSIMVLGPKVVVWKCFFEKFIKKFCGTNLCVCCICGYRFGTVFSAATKYIQTTSNMVLGPKAVVWKCFFEKFIKKFCGTNLCVNCTCGYPFRTAFSAATKYIQTTSNTVLGPKVVVWKCSFEKFKKKFCGTNLCVNCTWGSRFRTAFSAATKYIKTTSNMVLGPKVVVWMCSFEKFKKKVCCTNLCVKCTWGTRFRTAFSVATKYIQTTSNMVLGPKVVVWKCFFDKFNKKFCGTNLCVNCTCGTRFRTAFSAATKYIQTTSNMVLGPKVVVWKCSFEKIKKKVLRHELVR